MFSLKVRRCFSLIEGSWADEPFRENPPIKPDDGTNLT